MTQSQPGDHVNRPELRGSAGLCNPALPRSAVGSALGVSLPLNRFVATEDMAIIHADQNHRRHGICGQLMETLIDLAETERITRILLITGAASRPARVLYETLGA